MRAGTRYLYFSSGTMAWSVALFFRDLVSREREVVTFKQLGQEDKRAADSEPFGGNRDRLGSDDTQELCTRFSF